MVRCRDCGLLALRDAKTRQICEAEIEWRKSINTEGTSISERQYVTTPLCLASKESFSHKIEEIRDKINRERICNDGFIEWQQGFTPKEHIQMNLLQQQLQNQREWQQIQSEENRRWQESMEAKNRTITLLCSAIGIGAAMAGTAFGFWLSSQ